MDGQGRRHWDIEEFLHEHHWVPAPFLVRFLAAGEYNENYVVESDDRPLVFRINHGTQLGLDDQIGYEFDVLHHVAPSGVTPRPLQLCRSHRLFPRGALLMEYLPGRPLDYRVDLNGAAACFAAIHSLPYDPDTGPLLVQSSPVSDIIRESTGLLARHADHPLPEHGSKIRRYMEQVRELESTTAFEGESLCIVNSEVNSGNFVVDGRTVRLVDWEKAVASFRYQDLGHFLVATTTLWKSDFRFQEQTRREFLERYYELARPPVSYGELDRQTNVMERTILLRAFSWVYMAWAEYASGARPLTNDATFATMQRYLDEIDGFLGHA